MVKSLLIDRTYQIMEDRLVWLLDRFGLNARVFQAGAFRCDGTNPATPGTGYLHILYGGRVRVTSERV